VPPSMNAASTAATTATVLLEIADARHAILASIWIPPGAVLLMTCDTYTGLPGGRVARFLATQLAAERVLLSAVVDTPHALGLTWSGGRRRVTMERSRPYCGQ